jgi:hypothetical protein
MASATSAGGKGKNSAKKKPIRERKDIISNNTRDTTNIEQHILTDNIDKIERFYQKEKKLFGYRTFRQVNGDGSKIINRLRGIDDLSAFYNIEQSVLSLMQPKIRIFRVTYEEVETLADGRTTGARSATPVPCYREFIFSDNFGNEVAPSAQEYLAYESTKPSFRNVGFQAFSMEQIGESHGAIENNIECTLKLSFKSLKDLNAQPPGEPAPPKGLRYVDLILFPETKVDNKTHKYNPNHYQIKVLIGYTAPTIKQLAALNLSARQMTAISKIEKLNMLISLGLYDHTMEIKEDGRVDLEAKYRGAIETTLGSNQVNIFQDSLKMAGGSSSVEDNVKKETLPTRLTGIATELRNIHKELNKESCSDLSCEGRKKLKKKIENDGILRKYVSRAAGRKVYAKIVKATKNGFTINGDTTFKWFEKIDNVQRVLAEMKKDVGKYKQDVYRTFVDKLIEGDGQGGSRLFCASAGTKAIQKLMDIVEKVKEDAPKDKEEKLERDRVIKAATLATSKELEDVVEFRKCKEFRGYTADATNAAERAALSEETANQIASSVSGETGSKEKNKKSKKESVISSKTKSYQFYFLMLGDIIELACKNAGMKAIEYGDDATMPFIYNKNSYVRGKESAIDYPLTGMRMLLGPVDYYDAGGKLKRINLAQFPVSFNNFRAWFLDKVVRRQRSQMSLSAFVTSLVNDLVMPSLSAEFIKTYKPRNTRTQAIALTLPGKQIPGQSVRVCGRETARVKELLPKQRVINIDSPDFIQGYFRQASTSVPSESSIKTSYDYWLIYISTIKEIRDRDGRPQEDLEDGIYHFNIGSDVGLLKSMKFKKTNVPGMVELRSLQQMENGNDGLEQLTFPYNVDLELFGNSLFMPGMTFYANPSMLGLGTPEDANSVAHQLNLGGYFFVGRTGLSIGPGKFTTSVKGLQLGHGRARGRS